jgi:hypothetical protein
MNSFTNNHGSHHTMPFLYCYYTIYTLCNHCLSQCDTTLRLCRYLLWITVHEVMVPVRFPCATLLQTHDDTLTFTTFCSATTAGALDKFFNFTWTTINSLSTRTLHGNANSSDSRLISTPFSTCTTWATPFYRKGGDC